MAFYERISNACLSENVSQCDRCALKLLCKNLIQLDQNGSVLRKEANPLRQFKQFFEEIGLLAISTDGQIQFSTQRADILLKNYTLQDDSHTLPELLQHWFRYQMSQQKTVGNVRSSGLPLSIEQAGRRLVIRLLPSVNHGQFLLLLEEQELQVFTIDSLELLGLTRREAEVLFWMAKDKSNAEIAGILGCSKGTIRKHLENIYRKLGVQTRIAAVMTALESLGLLKEPIVA